MVGPNMTIKIMLVVGARPQIIKSAPIIHASHAAIDIDLEIVHTGQHYDYEMSKVFFDELSLPDPLVNLNVGSGTHAWQTGEMMKRLERVVRNVQPRCILVPGDTNSTLAGALAAAKLGVPVAHLEAGARCADMNLPEEINRVLTDHCSHLLFAPTSNCTKNLLKEGISPARIFARGDTHYDAFRAHTHEISRQNLSRWLDMDKPFVYTTIHRPENVDSDENLKEISHALLKLRSLQIVFPVHPRTKRRLRETGIWRKLKASAHVKFLSPVTYLQSLALTYQSSVVITDSGGLQREAFWLGTPCIVMRRTTEWPETLANKRTMLAPAKSTAVVKMVRHLLRTDTSDEKLPSHHKLDSPFGDGHAARRILQDLRQHLRIRSRPH
jgi:UDP-GlcNAc3NAcA epimerase